jgi:hypothetical protein
VAKSDLPREIDRQTLDYDRLISTLETVDGTTVVVRLTARAEPGCASGAASIIGELRRQQGPGRFEGDEFSLGSPYPDRSPVHLAGGVLFLNKQTFEGATLSTFDGNDHFIISIKLRCLEILVQDADSTYP